MWRHINCPIYHLLFPLCPGFPTYIEHRRPPLAEKQTSIMMVKQERFHKHVQTTVWFRVAKDKKITEAYLYDWQCFIRNTFGIILVADVSKTIAFVSNFPARMPSATSKAFAICNSMQTSLACAWSCYFLPSVRCCKMNFAHISNLGRQIRSNVVNSCLP